MALSKFLFTSSERKDSLLAPFKYSKKVFRESVDKYKRKLEKSEEYERRLKRGDPTAEELKGEVSFWSKAGSLLMVGATAPLGFMGLLADIGEKVFYQEMYLNPDSLRISYTSRHTKKELLGGVVVNHYRTEVPTIEMSGAIGWIRLESRLDSALNAAINAMLTGSSAEKVGKAFAEPWKDISFRGNFLKNLKRTREQLRNAVNSPRKFMDELQHLALSPMYYKDERGIERYNLKEIVIFTKRYPNGAVLQGYFESFSYDEKGNESETIKYNARFVALNIKPVGLAERLGQFIAPFYGIGLEVSGAVQNIAGLGKELLNIF